MGGILICAQRASSSVVFSSRRRHSVASRWCNRHDFGDLSVHSFHALPACAWVILPKVRKENMLSRRTGRQSADCKWLDRWMFAKQLRLNAVPLPCSAVLFKNQALWSVFSVALAATPPKKKKGGGVRAVSENGEPCIKLSLKLLCRTIVN